MRRRDFLALAGSVGASALLLRSASSASAAFDFGAIRPQIDEKVSAYMQANSVPGVAIGVAGLPALPFRTDDWPLVLEVPKAPPAPAPAPSIR